MYMSIHGGIEEVNIRIAELLSEELGLNCRPERPSDRSDIRCYYRGFNIVIEPSYDRGDAEDARKRIEREGFDIAIALWLKEGDRYRADLSVSELKELIRGSRFDAALLAPSPQPELVKFISKGSARLSAGWFIDVDLGFIRDLVNNSIEYLIREGEFQVALSKVIDGVNNFIQVMSRHQRVWQDIYDILYRLYGLSLTEARDDEVVFGQAGLSILLSTVLYEHVRSAHGLGSIHSYVENHGPIEGLRRALEEGLKHDYGTAVETTIKILDKLPPTASNAVRRLINLGIWVSQNNYLLRRDFAGRVYHRIVGDIAHRKGFATFYTEVPSAYLLATLAVNTLFRTDEKPITMLSKDEAQAIANKISGTRVGDFACGSGTLLTAAYNALMHLASTMNLHNININLDNIGKALIEDGVYGIDALRYASRITAINLALIGPQGKITRENIFTIYLGTLNESNAHKGPWLGSLELLNNGHVGGILSFIEGGLQGAVERVSVSGVEGVFTIPNEFDLIIMNPPFTRATGRTEAYGERRGLFGFITDEKNRQSLLNNLNKVRDRASEFLSNNAKANKELFPPIIQEIIEGKGDLGGYLDIGKAGEGLLFLYLAHRFIKDGGVVAFVLPRNLLMGVSWFLARVLLATKYHLKYIIVSSDPNGYNFSESTGISEVLIVARRQDKHSPDEETVFINLLRKPSTALEAVALADEIMNKHVTLGNVATAHITRVKRSGLLNYILNWNTLANEWLFNYLDSMVRSSMVSIGNIIVKTPLTQLNTFIDFNTVNRHNMVEAFNLIVHGNRVDCDAYRNKPNAPYVPMICGGGEGVTNRMLIQPNAYVPDANNDTAMTIKSLRSRFFLPYRIIWDTFHTIALRSTEEAISNVYFMVRTNLTEEQEKALILWLNSFWGILTVFSFMEITVGAFTGLNIAQWRVLPILNVRGLSEDAVKCLANAFDKHVNTDFGRFPKQFERGTRMDMDIDVIKCLSTPISEEDAKALRSDLSELYAQFNTTLRQISGR
ncbi:MAG: hypothetical protein RXN91_08865 [Caldivirga sp.]